MKKLAIMALVLTMGFMVSVEAGAASVGIPWFVDNAGTAVRVPPTDGGVVTLIYLNNGAAGDVECMITYFTQDGVDIGPTSNNTFEIPASSTVAFRPVADDPASVTGGQESEVARAIPNRPLGTVGGNDNKKNGSAKIVYNDAGGKITGKSETFQHALADPAATAKGYATISHAYLLPAGS